MAETSKLKRLLRVIIFLFLGAILVYGQPIGTDGQMFSLRPGFASNLSGNERCFQLEQMGLSYKDMTEILLEIQQMDSSESPALNAWKYVLENSFHHEPFSISKLNYSPDILVNSTGFGECGDRASVLAAIWTAMGFQARVWGLEGHMVCEVNEGGEWKIFDPDMGCYFVDENNRIASYHDLTTDAEFSLKTYHPLQMPDDIGHSELFLRGNTMQAYLDTMRRLYRTTEDNREMNPEYFLTGKNITSTITLPRWAEMAFYQIDSLRDDVIPVKNFIEVTLLPGAQGTLYLPLLPLGCSGRFKMTISGEQLSISGSHDFQNAHQHIDTFTIKQVRDTTRFYFLANGISFVADSRQNERVAYQRLLYALEAVPKINQLDGSLNVTTIEDDMYQRLIYFTRYLESENASISSQEELDRVFSDFQEKVYDNSSYDRGSYERVVHYFFTLAPIQFYEEPALRDNPAAISALCFILAKGMEKGLQDL